MVSVVIPTFNRMGMLGEAIESVLGQSFHDFELIVVDDGSTDDTLHLMRKYPRARYIRERTNSGVSHARNVGIQNATGRYISFLDSDDLWKKDKLEAQTVWMEANPDWMVSYTDEIWLRRGVPVNQMKKHEKFSGDIFQQCLALCIVSPSSVMFRRPLFTEMGTFDERLPACEDYDLWLRIAARYPIKFIPRKLIVKRGGHADQLSQKYQGMDEFRVYTLQKLLLDQGLEIEKRRLVIETLIEKSAILQRGFAKNFKVKEAEVYQGIIDRYTAELRRPAY
jgi:glycosyltransferase involved in cell wall biosynthesis